VSLYFKSAWLASSAEGGLVHRPIQLHVCMFVLVDLRR